MHNNFPPEDNEVTLLVADPSTCSSALRYALGINNQSKEFGTWKKFMRHDLDSLSKKPQYQLLYVDTRRGVASPSERISLQEIAASESFDR